jgi:polysaccharide export outer membrane protein
MDRNAQIFLRMSMIAGAFALLILCVRAAQAQEAPPPGAQQAQSYGLVPVQNAQPDGQPYGVKPIPGYTPPAPMMPPQSSPPDMLRGSETDAPPLQLRPPQSEYGYVPLRQAEPMPLQAPLRASTASGDAGDTFAMPEASRQIAYQPAPDPGRGASDYQLGPGDKVRVTVFGESDLSGEYQIDGSGMVRLPLIGTLKASGATAPVLEQNIAAALADGYIKSPRVNVEIALYRPFYIIGAVNRPGQYAYVDHMSALNAVALAGGFTDQAIQSTLYVRHEGSTAEQAVETSQLTHILPGDVVRVRTSPFWEAMNLFSPVAGPAAIAAAAWH